MPPLPLPPGKPLNVTVVGNASAEGPVTGPSGQTVRWWHLLGGTRGYY